MKANCEIILLRQFDADCRDNSQLPADVAQHLAQCSACQQEWFGAQQFDQALSQQLLQTPGNNLYRRAYIAAVATPTTATESWQRWSKLLLALGSGVSSAACVHVLAGFNSVNWITLSVFLLLSSAVYLTELFRDLNEEVND